MRSREQLPFVVAADELLPRKRDRDDTAGIGQLIRHAARRSFALRVMRCAQRPRLAEYLAPPEAEQNEWQRVIRQPTAVFRRTENPPDQRRQAIQAQFEDGGKVHVSGPVKSMSCVSGEWSLRV